MDFNGLWILGSRLMMTEDRFSRVHNVRDRSEMVLLIDARRHLCTLF